MGAKGGERNKIRKRNGSPDELPFDFVPNGFFMFPLCYLLCRSGRTRYTGYARGSRGTGGTRRTGCPRRARCPCRPYGSRRARCPCRSGRSGRSGRPRQNAVAVHNSFSALPAASTGAAAAGAVSLINRHVFPPFLRRCACGHCAQSSNARILYHIPNTERR